jgi:tetratricopeptide (TPR) repeat protein
MREAAASAGRILLLCLGLGLGLVARAANAADDNGARVREADKHFQNGVTLYIEADYRAALVEFNRAFALAPNGVVLFNVAETQYQLRDYAGALATFERYLAEAPPSDGHRAVAESSLKELRTRVGRLTITTVPSGAEVSIDDRVIGKTPLDKAVIVGIGHVTVRASRPGRSPAARAVDVAAEDDVSLTLELPALAAVRADALSPSGLTDRAAPSSKDGRSWRIAGWVATGVLAAGAVGVGLLARHESGDLRAARELYPANASTIDRLADRTTTYAVIADSIAAAALVVGGITLYSSLSARAGGDGPRVAVGLGSVRLDMKF